MLRIYVSNMSTNYKTLITTGRRSTRIRNYLPVSAANGTASERTPAVTAADIVQVRVLGRIPGLRQTTVGPLLAENCPALGAGDPGAERCLQDAATPPVIDQSRDDQDREQAQDDP